MVSGQGFQLEWARTYRLDPSKTNQSWKILLAADGVIVGGTSAGVAGDADYVVIKYAANGNQAWSYRHDSFEGVNDELRALAIDPAGNVFATGTTDTVKLSSTGALVWNVPLPGRAVVATTNFVYVTGSSDLDYSTTQLENNDVDGKENWTRVYGLKLRDVSDVIALAANGDVLIGGTETVAAGNLPRFPRSGVVSMISYSPRGDVRWHEIGYAYPVFNSDRCKALNISIDQKNSAYILGRLDAMYPIERFNTNGVRTLSNHDGGGMSAITATSDGYYALAGGGELAFVSKGGPPYWVQTYGNEGAEARDILADPNGNIYTAGFDPEPATGNDVFLIKYTAIGSRVGLIVYDSPHHGHDVGNAMVRDAAGNVYIVGYSTTPEGGTEFLTLKYSDGPKIEQQPSGAMHLEFYSTPGQRYALEATTDFF
jgi:hypothetical protein